MGATLQAGQDYPDIYDIDFTTDINQAISFGFLIGDISIPFGINSPFVGYVLFVDINDSYRLKLGSRRYIVDQNRPSQLVQCSIEPRGTIGCGGSDLNIYEDGIYNCEGLLLMGGDHSGTHPNCFRLGTNIVQAPS
jgi:hypothetical protein